MAVKKTENKAIEDVETKGESLPSADTPKEDNLVDPVENVNQVNAQQEKEIQEYYEGQKKLAELAKQEQEKLKAMKGFFYVIQEYNVESIEMKLEDFADIVRTTEYAQLIQVQAFPYQNFICALIFYRALEKLHP